MKQLQRYFHLLKEVISTRLLTFFLLYILLTITFYFGADTKIKFFLLLVFFISFIIQFLLLKRSSFALYVVRTLVVILFLFEFILGKVNHAKSAAGPAEVYDNFTEAAPLVGFRLTPGLAGARSMLAGKDTIYNVLYASDAYGRRVAFNNIDSVIANYHALFLGCSYTFGHGLNFDATFPYLFQQQDTNYRSYNYGFEAWGPNQLALLFDPGINTINRDAVREQHGFAIYTFINDHLNRVYGGSDYLAFTPATPDVYVNINELVIKKRSRLQVITAKLLNESETLKYFNIKNWYPTTENYYKRFAAIINYTALKYSEQFNGSKFYVGLYPMPNKDTAWIKYLNKSIQVVDVPLPADYEKNKSGYHLSLQYDIHPSGLLNKYYANYIANIIKNK